MPVELGLYRKIQPQLPGQYRESTLPILLSQERQSWKNTFFFLINIVCIMTQVGIHGEIQPEPSENPLHSALKISIILRVYFTLYPSCYHNTYTYSTVWGTSVPMCANLSMGMSVIIRAHSLNLLAGMELGQQFNVGQYKMI